MFVAHFLQHHVAANRGLGERPELGFFDFEGGGRNRGAVRIVARLAQRVGHALDQFLRDGVLQSLGFDMHVPPVIAELAREIRFEDPMATDHLQRGAPPLRRQLHAAIRHMFDESRFGEPFHHAADGRRCDFEHLGDVAGRRETALIGEMKNRFEIVFDRPRQRGLGRTNRGVHGALPSDHCQPDRALG